MSSLLSLGLSGLHSSQAGLTVTGHNIANAKTPGYSRQETVQGTRTPQFYGYGYVGSGSTVEDVRRISDQFLTDQVRYNTIINSDSAAYKDQIDQLDSLLSKTSTGIGPALERFFSAFKSAAGSPSDIASRQLVLSEAEGLAKRFNSVYDRMDQQNQYINQQMGAVTGQVNRLATSIAGYNDAIATSQSNGKVPNDLIDARDEQLRQLSELVGVQTLPQDDGSINVFVGTGQSLVVGNKTNTLQMAPDPKDPSRQTVQIKVGDTVQNISSQINGGQLGGLIRYREEALDPAYNALGRMSMVISDKVNEQLGLGLDLKGNVGSTLFNDINTPDAMANRSYPTGMNVKIENTSQLTTDDYEVKFTDTSVVPAEYELRRGDGSLVGTYKVGEDTGQGFSLTPNATPKDGDTFNIMPTRRAAGSFSSVLKQPDQLAFAAPIRSEANGQNLGTGKISQADLIDGQSPLDLANLKLATPVKITYNSSTGLMKVPSGVTLTRVDPSTGYAPAADQTFQSGQTNTYEMTLSDGSKVRFTMDGRPENGDDFSVDFNEGGVSDNRNGLAVAGILDKPVISVDPAVPGSGLTVSDAHGDMIERVGTLAAQAKSDTATSGAMLNQAQQNRDSVAGVNLDEEAAKLIQFQQYYKASAQVIQSAQTLFDTLINTFR